MTSLHDALLHLLRWLAAERYHFTTITPATQARVLARAPGAPSRTLRDVFGYSRAFEPTLLPAHVLAAMRSAELLADADADADADGARLRSAVRVSSLHGMLFAHSAYPTSADDAVFFGPDSHRFADLIAAELARHPLPDGGRILDLGCGAGPGGIVAARATRQPRLVLTDINPRALPFASANAAHAGIADPRLLQGDLFAPVTGPLDLIVANPPYLNDAARRTYRHGGGHWGEALSARIVQEALPRLAPGGRLVLYTGAAMVDGTDPLLAALQPHLPGAGWQWSYRELDPDVFGEELEEPAYRDAERIAAVALIVARATD